MGRCSLLRRVNELAKTLEEEAAQPAPNHEATCHGFLELEKLVSNQALQITYSTQKSPKSILGSLRNSSIFASLSHQIFSFVFRF
jgi:hypothetical protein